MSNTSSKMGEYSKTCDLCKITKKFIKDQNEDQWSDFMNETDFINSTGIFRLNEALRDTSLVFPSSCCDTCVAKLHFKQIFHMNCDICQKEYKLFFVNQAYQCASVFKRSIIECCHGSKYSGKCYRLKDTNNEKVESYNKKQHICDTCIYTWLNEGKIEERESFW